MIRSMLLLALASAVALATPAQAGPVRIDDFKFGCKTPSGQQLKPQFGDMDGMYYSEIEGNEDACDMAVKRRIANCHQHTRFLAPADNEKYPGCLPVFADQAKACIAHFRNELPKCRGDGGSGTGGGAGGRQGQGGKTAEPSCAETYGSGWTEMCMALPANQRDAVAKHMGLKPGPKGGCGGRPGWSFCAKP